MITDIMSSARFQAATATTTATGSLLTVGSKTQNAMSAYSLSEYAAINTTILTTAPKTFAGLASQSELPATVLGAELTFTAAVKLRYGTSNGTLETVLIAGVYRFGVLASNGAWELVRPYDATVVQVGADATVGVQKVEARYGYFTPVAADGVLKTGAGFLHAVSITQTASASPTAGTLTLFDNTAESGSIIWGPHYIPNAAMVPISFVLDVEVLLGVYAGYATLAGVTVNASGR